MAISRCRREYAQQFSYISGPFTFDSNRCEFLRVLLLTTATTSGLPKTILCDLSTRGASKMSFNFFVILAVCWLMIFDKQLCMEQAADEQSSPSPIVDHEAESETNVMAKSSEPIQQIPFPDCLPLHHYEEIGPLGIYKLHLNISTWEDAREICRQEGAHLAIIHSEAEAKVLSTMVAQMVYLPGASEQNVAFIGIHDLFEEGEWVTVLDDPINATCYTNWAKNYAPDPSKNCGILQKDGTLDATRCGCKLAFICKKPYPCPPGKCC